MSLTVIFVKVRDLTLSARLYLFSEYGVALVTTGKTSNCPKPARHFPICVLLHCLWLIPTLSVREFGHRQCRPAGAADKIGVHLGIGSIATNEQTSFEQIHEEGIERSSSV